MTKHGKSTHQTPDCDAPQRRHSADGQDIQRENRLQLNSRPTSLKSRPAKLDQRLFSAPYADSHYMSIPLPPQPPTPQSPYYPTDDESCDGRGLASGYLTPVTSQPQSMSSSYNSNSTCNALNSLRIDLGPPSPLDFPGNTHPLRSSPGSLSSCSTATSIGHASDYFECAPQQSQAYVQHQQMQFPISPVAIPQYQQQFLPSHQYVPSHPAPQYHQTAYAIHNVPVEIQQPTEPWCSNGYDQFHVGIAPQPRPFYQEMPMSCIKQEPENTMLATPRGSFC